MRFVIVAVVVNILAFGYESNKDIIYHYSDIKKLEFYNMANSKPILNFENLKKLLYSKNKKIQFACNGGMFLQDFSPQGLFVQDGKLIKKLNTKHSNYGNFYMQPNGVFYITKDGNGFVVKSKDFKFNKNIKYATQSGPMLLVDGKINSKFNPSSKSLYVRNGVCVLDKKALFAISKEPINFYNFANFFKKMGCKDALYLDGYVSKFYPQARFSLVPTLLGVFIAETKE